MTILRWAGPFNLTLRCPHPSCRLFLSYGKDDVLGFFRHPATRSKLAAYTTCPGCLYALEVTPDLPDPWLARAFQVAHGIEDLYLAAGQPRPANRDLYAHFYRKKRDGYRNPRQRT
jgi:hypothetical protein